MKAGRMRKRGELQQPVKSKSPTGQQLEAWERYDTVWIGVEPVSSRLRLASEQIYADVTHRGIVRFHSQIRHGHRVIVNGKIFEVTSVINRDERNRELELMLIETK